MIPLELSTGTAMPALPGMSTPGTRKQQLVVLVNSSPLSACQVAQLENVNYSTLRKYKRLAAMNMPSFERHGRPSILDEISLQDMLINLQLNCDNDCVEKNYFKGLMMQERSNTNSRRFGRSEVTLRPMSKATVEKYFRICLGKLSALLGREVRAGRRYRSRRALSAEIQPNPSFIQEGRIADNYPQSIQSTSVAQESPEATCRIM